MRKRKSIVLGVLLLTSSAVARVPVTILPDPDFDQLLGDDFRERAEAQRSYLEWIASDPAYARKTLMKRYLTSKDPEQRARLFSLVERAFFPPDKGYVGIRMRPTFHVLRQNPAPVGVTIFEVVPGSPADRHGLLVGDQIVAINDWRASAHPDVTKNVANQIQSHKPGELIRLTVLRGGTEKLIDFRLGLLPTPGEQKRHLISPDLAVASGVKEFRAWFEKEKRKLAAMDRS